MARLLISVNFFCILTALSADCNNPIFSPSVLTVNSENLPCFLTMPFPLTNKDWCEGIHNGPETCCSGDTLQEIRNYIQRLENSLKKVHLKFYSKIKNTFKEFSIETQKFKLSDFDIEDIIEQDQFISGVRPRPGIIKLSSYQRMQIDKVIEQIFNVVNALKRSGNKCIQGQILHLTGKLCIGCDPYWTDYIKDEGDNFNILIDKQVCAELVLDCSEYADIVSRLPEIVEESGNEIKRIIVEAVEGDAELSIDMFGVEDLDEVLDSRVIGCSIKADCRDFICGHIAGLNGEFTTTHMKFVKGGVNTYKVGKASRDLSIALEDLDLGFWVGLGLGSLVLMI